MRNSKEFWSEALKWRRRLCSFDIHHILFFLAVNTAVSEESNLPSSLWLNLLTQIFLLNASNLGRSQNQLKWQLRSHLSLQLSPSLAALLWVVWKEENCIPENTKIVSKAARGIFNFSTIFFRLSWCQRPMVTNRSGRKVKTLKPAHTGHIDPYAAAQKQLLITQILPIDLPGEITVKTAFFRGRG